MAVPKMPQCKCRATCGLIFDGKKWTCGACLRDKIQKTDALHASIIDQGRKVLNATSEIGMSHAEFIEWAIGELEGK